MNKRNFLATLIQNENMDAAYIEIPFEVEQEYGAKRVKVKAILNGVEYRGSLVRMKTSCHILGIPKAIRHKIGVNFGDTISVELEKDEEERVVVLPDDLKNKLSKSMLNTFKNLSYSKQKQYISAIESAKSERTRVNRIEKIIKEVTTLE